MNYATKPIPHTEAEKLIASKPAIAREVFDELPDELRGRAFTITGIEDMDVLQAVRDEIAKLPAGANWDSVKKEIAAKISPWFDPAAAERRASLLLSHHGFAAYSAAQARIMDEMIEIFPYRQYLTTGDGKVRASHAALDGIILPADHPFWAKHTPPWEWNCRCQVVELTGEDMEEEQKRDAKRDPAAQRVLGDVAQKQIEQGSLVRGPSQRVDVRTPKERGGNYEWSAKDAAMPYDQIKERWAPDVQEAFEKWAEAVPMEGGTSLLAHLSGLAPGGGAQVTTRTATFQAALDHLGLAEKTTWSRADLADLRAAMKKESPLPAAMKIESIEGARKSGELTAREITRSVQDMLDILPRDLASSLPELRIKLLPRFTENGKKTHTAGMYRKGGSLRLATDSLKGLKGAAKKQEMRRILSHELMHWVHLEAKGPQADAYRAAIATHYQQRTAGAALETSPYGYKFRRDGWWNLYAGAQYEHEKGAAQGLEIPSTHFELWENPEKLAELVDLNSAESAAFRETFSLIQTIFNKS